ncbi:hypothetical protein VTN77DRAFT_9492 [Rasamsonia byssochlamydoides]|uniref:uncharacterized protein n=1 Tax=Rasamsonia byssochlamydoides TaxID=89139 RepID=UPI003741F32D
MKKTLLLVFVHGFKGGNDTFGKFPEHLTAFVSRALPNIDVLAVTYPKYETRGELKECVARFREWLQDKVIDLEVANQTPSPTIDPSVHVILLGHSMGGIVGAETLLLLASEQPLPPPSSLNKRTESATGRPSSPVETAPFFMFPHIQGLVAFDTPFLGIAPGVVSHGAEEHYKTATTAYSALSEVAGLFGLGGSKTTSRTTTTTSTRKALPLPAATGDATSDDAAATPSWQRWGRYAMFAGAAGAVAAGGAAALYSQRDRITAGWSWMASHLEFVGCLARPGDLRKRVASLTDLHKDRGIGSVNFYTCLGRAAAGTRTTTTRTTSQTRGTSSSSSFIRRLPRGKIRTFCQLPEDFDKDDPMISNSTESGLKWLIAVNDKAQDETTAHTAMFTPRDNPSYYKLAGETAKVIVRLVDEGWYASATRPQPQPQLQLQRKSSTAGCRSQVLPRNGTDSQEHNHNDSGFMEADDVVVVDQTRLEDYSTV